MNDEWHDDENPLPGPTLRMRRGGKVTLVLTNSHESDKPLSDAHTAKSHCEGEHAAHGLHLSMGGPRCMRE